MREVDIAIIGGGAAGMAAAVSARINGIDNILLIERNDTLGGVLRQCIHNGFGLHRFQEDLTGVEFAARYRNMVERMQIPCMLSTFVIHISEDRIITVVSPQEGLVEIRAKAVILAMGCRERTRNNLLIPGSRGAGIMTAGTAQRYLNINGFLPGRRIVIVGSGDIGLIMARQFILEGAEVAGIVEILPYSSGLPRNMKQCVEDFDIPVYFSSSVTLVKGKERVRSVLVSRVDENRQVIPGTEFEIDCDTLLISAGLIPENELSEEAGVELSDTTKGAVVTEDHQTSVPGIFACGNVLHVHDLVDFVSEEGEETGIFASDYVKKLSVEPKTVQSGRDLIRVVSGTGVGGIVPHFVNRRMTSDHVVFMFRPREKYTDAFISIKTGNEELFRKKYLVLTPGEMCRVDLPKEALISAGQDILIEIQE